MLVRVSNDPLELQKAAANVLLVGKILCEIGLHAGFGRVDFQAGEDGQDLRLSAVALPVPIGRVLVIGQDAAPQGGVGDLSDPGGEGAFHSFKPGVPILGVSHQRFCRRDLEQGQIVLIFQAAAVVAPNALVQNRIGVNVDGVAVVVRAAQPVRDQAAAVHHGDVVQVRQVFLPQRPNVRQRRCQSLLVPGNMGIAENGQPGLHGEAGLRCVKHCTGQAFPEQGLIRSLGGRLDDGGQQPHQIVGEIPGVPADHELAQAELLPDRLRLLRQLLLEDTLFQERRVLPQQLGPLPARVSETHFGIGKRCGEVIQLPGLVCHRIVIGRLGCLGQPDPLRFLRRGLPAKGKLCGTVFLRSNGGSVQKLVVQLGQSVAAAVIHAGDEKAVPVPAAAVQVLRPAQPVLLHPAQALAHASGQNHVHLFHGMPHAEQIGNLRNAELRKQSVEVHCVDHALDIGQANLEGEMPRFQGGVTAQHVSQLLGDQALAVKFQNLNVCGLLHPGVAAHGMLGAVILHGDDGDVLHDAAGIVHDHNVVGVHPESTVAFLDPLPVAEQQPVVGVELGKLTLPELHAQGDPLPHWREEIRPEKGQLVLAAHAGRALKGHKAVGFFSEIHQDALRPEEPFSPVLEFLDPTHRATVKDAGEVQIDHCLLELVRHKLQPRRPVSVQGQQKLPIHPAVALGRLPDGVGVGGGFHIEIEAEAGFRFCCAGQQGPRRNLINVITLQTHDCPPSVEIRLFK